MSYLGGGKMRFRDLETALTEEDVDIFNVDTKDGWRGRTPIDGDWCSLAVRGTIGIVLMGSGRETLVWFGRYVDRKLAAVDRHANELAFENLEPEIRPSEFKPDEEKLRDRASIGQLPARVAGKVVRVGRKLGVITRPITERYLLIWFGDKVGSVPMVEKVPLEHCVRVLHMHRWLA